MSKWNHCEIGFFISAYCLSKHHSYEITLPKGTAAFNLGQKKPWETFQLAGDIKQ